MNDTVAEELTFIPISDFENRRLILGQIIMLMMDSPIYLADPLWVTQKYLIGPFLSNQAIVMFDKDSNLIGYASWAWLTKEKEQAYHQDSNCLEPQDWTAGDNLWLVDVLAPQHGAIELLNFTREYVAAQGHKGKIVKFKRYFDIENFKIQEVTL
jgi:cytolysin-activating lysine-acyltransferase